jgi:hypothetical protein
MTRTPIAIVVSAMTLGLAGCGVVPPQVQYQPYSAASDAKFGYPIRPRRSIILVKFDSKQNTFSAEAAPYELDPSGTTYLPLFQMSGLDDWKATTQLKVTYVDNTKIVDTIEVTTKDNVADTINKIGDVGAAVVPVLAGLVAGGAAVAAGPFKDTTIDPAKVKADEWQPDEINAGYCLKLGIATVEQGLPLKDYMSARQGATARDFPVSSCASAVLAIATCQSPAAITAPVQTLRVVYASAEQVTPMPLPSSGTLKMNTVCGAVVTEADKQDRRQVSAYLTTLMDNVKKVEAAKKK